MAGGGIPLATKKLDAAEAQKHAHKPVFAIPTPDLSEADVYFPESFEAALTKLGLPTEKLHGRIRLRTALLECW